MLNTVVTDRLLLGLIPFVMCFGRDILKASFGCGSPKVHNSLLPFLAANIIFRDLTLMVFIEIIFFLFATDAGKPKQL